VVPIEATPPEAVSSNVILSASYDLENAQQRGILWRSTPMKKIFLTALFMLATLAWAAAQQPANPPNRSGPPPGSQGQAMDAPVTEGCLGGTNPNFTITDKAGTTYKLNIPPSADTSKLGQHVGEAVAVAGNVNTSKGGDPSIDVQGIGRGTGTCPGAKSTQPPPKQ
jgi:hypothetical protein